MLTTAIILAAGRGLRMGKLTADRPKCLVELAGKPLITWQISSLRAAGIERIAVVAGYRAKMLLENQKRLDIDEIYVNDNFAETNMAASLFCARKEMGRSPAIISYGDIIYSPEPVRAVLGSKKDFAVAVDLEWRGLWNLRFENPLLAAETLRYDSRYRLCEIGEKPKRGSDIMAQYIGLIRFTPKAAPIAQASYQRALADSEAGRGAWGRPISAPLAFMTDLLQGLIDEGRWIEAVPIKGHWLEVDSPSDLDTYERLWRMSPGGGIYNLGRT